MLPLYLLATTLLVVGCLTAGNPALSEGVEGLPLALSTVGAPMTAVLRRRRGRPRKFAGPSRAVTLTLPESVIATLTNIDRDLSRAIVNLTTRRTPGNGHGPAELSVFGRRAVITVQPSASFATRTGVEFVPLPDGRALISMDQPRSVADLELMLDDALDDPQTPAKDRQLFESVRDILREARRSSDVTLLRRSIIVLEGVKRSPRAAAGASQRTKPR